MSTEFMNDQLEMFADVIEESGTVQDQSKASTGIRDVPPAGETIGRFTTYVELGPQMFSFQGRETGVAPAVVLGFELLHPVKNIKENRGQFLTLQYPFTKISMNPKARFFKLFNSMRYGREGIKHMAQMLTEPFRITIEHSPCGKYANIVQIARPLAMDLDTGEERPIKVPPVTRAIQFFMWGNPSKKCWESIFIDGEFTKDDGSTVSRNRFQETIQSSPAYEGSSVQAFLLGLDDEMPF